MSKLFVLLCFVVVGVSCDCSKTIPQELTFRLSGDNIEFPCDSTKNIYISTGRYTPQNVIGTRAQMYKDTAVVAFPRYKSGCPMTLGIVHLKKGSYSTPASPFPCWLLQEEGNCEALQSVVDLYLDEQGMLWVLDVGVVHTLTQPIQRCKPKVVAINMHTKKVVKVLDLSNVITEASRLQYILVDYDKEGRAYVYIADEGNRAILVHDVTENKSYRVVLPVAVKDGSSKSDVLYMVLIRKADGQNVIYFTCLGSPRMFSIKTHHLQKGQGSGSVVDVGPKPNGQPIVILGTDGGHSMFLRYKGMSDIYLWDTETCFKSTHFLEVQRGNECHFSTQVFSGHKRYMWTIESNFHHYLSDTVGCMGASVLIHPVVRDCED